MCYSLKKFTVCSWMLDDVDQDTAVYIQDKAVNKVACVAGQKHCGRVQAPGLVVNLR